MFEQGDEFYHFNDEIVDVAIQLWMQSSITVIDVRKYMSNQEKALQDYVLPTSAFLFIEAETASLMLNNQCYMVKNFGLFHGCKGTNLSITSVCQRMKVYMILYKAEEAPFYKRSIRKLLNYTNPFIHIYGFIPYNPLYYTSKFQVIYESWLHNTPIYQLQTKAIFYQVVHHIYDDISKKTINLIEPDFVNIMKNYLDNHYAEDISIQAIIESLPISRSHLVRLFKQREHKSFQAYLNQKRIEAAVEHLENEHATIQEIAQVCGFKDELNMQRMFKKIYGITPSAYRLKMMAKMDVYDIDNDSQYYHNNKGLEQSFKMIRNEENEMLGKARGKDIVLAFAMSLILVLSACSSSTQTNVVQNEEGLSETVTKQMRTVNTIMGDVEVPMKPKRIVESGYWRGDILALGKTPIATQDFYVSENAYLEQMKGIEVLEKWEPEDIMTVDPDLIITGAEEDFKKLSKIAPTIVIPWGTPKEERLPLIAEALGLETSAGEKLIEEYEDKLANYKSKLEAKGMMDKTISVFRGIDNIDNGLEVSNKYFGAEIVYDQFGIKMLDTVKNAEAIGELSWEVIPDYVGDYILINIEENAQKQLEKNEIWNTIPAVQQGKVIMINPAKLYFPDILTETYKVELLGEELLMLANEQ